MSPARDEMRKGMSNVKVGLRFDMVLDARGAFVPRVACVQSPKQHGGAHRWRACPPTNCLHAGWSRSGVPGELSAAYQRSTPVAYDGSFHAALRPTTGTAFESIPSRQLPRSRCSPSQSAICCCRGRREGVADALPQKNGAAGGDCTHRESSDFVWRPSPFSLLLFRPD